MPPLPSDALDSTLLYYPNPHTGQASSTPLTLRQLCRIVCPSTPSTTCLLTPQTPLLRFDAASHSYDSLGWQPAASLPVLKEACSHWYYEEEGATRGPLSTRALAQRISLHSRAPRVFVSNTDNSSVGGEWKPVEELPHLMLALEAFRDVVSDQEQQQHQNHEVSKELQAFLQSTHSQSPDDEQEDSSDEGDTACQGESVPIIPHQSTGTKKRKSKKTKFSAKNARCWIYVTGLPDDTEEEEVTAYFSKCGIIDLDPETQKPKVKLYRGEQGTIKGDASICYARPESVELALQILDESIFRQGVILSVQRAKFEQHGSTVEEGDRGKNGRRKISEAKRKVARLAAIQAVGWDEGENGRIAGGLKGLRIVVLKHMFRPVDLARDESEETLQTLEQRVHSECEEMGVVEKITVFSKHPEGVIIVKFSQPNAASEAVQKFNGRQWEKGTRKVEASYWDGVTDFTIYEDENETEKRLDDFGDWLENQDVPEELQLRIDGTEGQ